MNNRFNLDTLKRDKEALKRALVEYGAIFSSETAFKCPAHDDRRASAGIFSDESGHWRYKCQACGWKGDLFDLYKLQGKVAAPKTNDLQINTKVELTGKLKKIGKLETVYKYCDIGGKIVFYVARISTGEGKEIRPFRLNGKGYVFGLPSPPRALYNLPAVSKADIVAVVEGEKCCNILAEYGITATTSVGGAKNAYHSDWSPLAGKKVILWPDNDAEGLKYMQDVKAILTNYSLLTKVFCIELEGLDLAAKEDCYDFITQLKNLGIDKARIKNELERVLQTAKSIRPSEDLKIFFDKVASGELEGIMFPFEKLNELSRALLPRSINLLCGTPGSGKSFFLLQSMLEWLKADIKFACYMLEESIDHHLQRALALAEDRPEFLDMKWIKNNHKEITDIRERRIEELDRLTCCITSIPCQQETYDGVIKWVEKQIKKGNKLLIIDPITAVEQKDRAWIYDARFLITLRKIVMDSNVIALISTHPKKGLTAPGMDDLAGGAAWQRFTQSVLWLEHHKEPKTENIKTTFGTIPIEINRTIHICKGRNAPGVGGKIGYKFGGKTLLFAEQGEIGRK